MLADKVCMCVLLKPAISSLLIFGVVAYSGSAFADFDCPRWSAWFSMDSKCMCVCVRGDEWGYNFCLVLCIQCLVV